MYRCYPELSPRKWDMDRPTHRKWVMAFPFTKWRILAAIMPETAVNFSLLEQYAWSFQVKHSSIINPRKCVFLSRSKFLSFMVILKSYFSFLLDDLNRRNFVLVLFSDNLTFSHHYYHYYYHSDTLMISACITWLLVLRQLLL